MCGWYKDDKRIEEMKNDDIYRNFRVEDIFTNPLQEKIDQLREMINL